VAVNARKNRDNEMRNETLENFGYALIVLVGVSWVAMFLLTITSTHLSNGNWNCIEIGKKNGGKCIKYEYIGSER
jgi:hypothetical protein